MGLGPSIKMTTLHHFRCPATCTLLEDEDIEFTGILVDGVSERYEDKIYTAKRTADIAKALGADGALVVIDGWGNHHVDFVNVIEELGKRGIPSVGLSYIGQQGRLVCDSPYVDQIIDFNKCSSGYESCVVGQNNLTKLDTYKALALLKSKLRKQGVLFEEKGTGGEKILGQLLRKYMHVRQVKEGTFDSLEQDILTINTNISSYVAQEKRIQEASLHVIEPGAHNFFVNSNLDFMPIAVKCEGTIGEGDTHVFSNVVMMLTGKEAVTGFQPSNIGSSEGILQNQVCFGQAGTPEKNDFLIHIDVLFAKGEGHSAQGIAAAHRLAEQSIRGVRECLRQTQKLQNQEIIQNKKRPGKPKIVLVKLVSGLGAMYDTVMFSQQPGGIEGGRMMRDTGNLPYLITPTQCLDGVIHSLL